MNKREAGRGFAWNVAGSFLAKLLIPIVFGIAITRILGPEQVGAVAGIFALATVLDVLKDMGLYATFVTDTKSDPQKDARYYGLSLMIVGAYSVALVVLSPTLAGLLRLESFDWAFAVAGVSAMCAGAGSLPGGKLHRDARFQELAVWDVVAQILNGSVTLALAIAGFGGWSPLFGALARHATLAAVTIRLAGPTYALPTAEFLRSIASRSVAFMANGLLYVLYTTADKMLALVWFGKANSGFYSVAYGLGQRPVDLLAGPMARTVVVAFSRAKDDETRFRDLFYRSISATLIVALPLYAMLAVYSTDIVTLMYGRAFAQSGILLTLLCTYFFSRILGMIASNLLNGIGKPGWSNYGWGLGFAAVGVSWGMGWMQAGIVPFAVTVSVGAAFAYLTAFAIVLVRFRPDRAQFGRVGRVVLAGLATAAVMLSGRLVPAHGVLQLLVGALLAAPFHVALLSRLFLGSWRRGLSGQGVRSLYASL
ncbi:MAG: oligosaccharide flippase family protein [Fimbriimonadaceae bacterium]